MTKAKQQAQKVLADQKHWKDRFNREDIAVHQAQEKLVQAQAQLDVNLPKAKEICERVSVDVEVNILAATLKDLERKQLTRRKE